MKERRPHTLLPRGLSRVEAAEYIGVSASKFDEMVRDGRMPGPKAIDARRVWDRHQIDRHFDDLPGPDEINEWDEVIEEKSSPSGLKQNISFSLGLATPPATPLNVRERKALNQLASHGVDVRVHFNEIEDCGPATFDRLIARGFVKIQNPESYPNRLGHFILTAAGMKAWEELG